MSRWLLALFAFSTVAAVDLEAQQPKATKAVTAVDVIDAFSIRAKRDLWPGFRPDTIPLAVYDGTRTWLVRHSSPPGEFQPYPARPTILVRDGRQPEVTANSSAKIGGRTVATLIPDLTRGTAVSWASVAAHEAFHAHQRTNHKSWIANEAVLFTYPWDNIEALGERRLEFEALRRAVAARGKAEASCWGKEAMAQRDARFALIGSDAATYESKSELNEGTAKYVQNRAGGTGALASIPAEEFEPSGVRDRVYASGGAMGEILDRLSPSWRGDLDRADSSASLHGLLRAAATRLTTKQGGCAFTPAEREAAIAKAAQDIDVQRAQLTAEAAQYSSQPGWSIVVDAADRTLNVGGFDPLNVARTSASTVIHRRYIKLMNDAGEFESIDQAVMTEAAGSHPLFSGVRRALVTGLREAPVVGDSSGAVTLKAGDLHLTFRGATVERDGQRLTIHLGSK